MRATTRFRPTAVEVGGFKSAIYPVAVNLRDLTILAGQNSAGKSTVIQPLLMIKQTIEKPFDPGGLAIDGPLVQFTSAEQFLSHSASGRATEFFVKMSSSDSSVTIVYRKASERGVTIDRMEFLENGKFQSWKENDNLEAEDVGIQVEILDFLRQSGNQFVVRRDRAILTATLEPKDGSATTIGFSRSPATAFIDSASKLIHLPGLRGNPERNYRVSAIETEYPW